MIKIKQLRTFPNSKFDLGLNGMVSRNGFMSHGVEHIISAFIWLDSGHSYTYITIPTSIRQVAIFSEPQRSHLVGTYGQSVSCFGISAGGSLVLQPRFSYRHDFFP